MEISWGDLPVIEEHREFLEGQALNPEIVHAHAIRSVTSVEDLPEEFTSYGDQILPAILFPWTDPDGTVHNQLRPAPGTLNIEGKPAKYVWAHGDSAELGVVRRDESDSRAIIVEGTKQCLSAGAYAPEGCSVYGIAGCRSWSSDGIPSPHLSVVSGKDVTIVLDADCATNHDVYEAATKLKEALEYEDARSVKFARLPGGRKTGLDDVLAKRPPESRSDYLAKILSGAKSKPADKMPKPKTLAEKRQEEAAETTNEPFLLADGRYQVNVGGDNIAVLENLTDVLRKQWDRDWLFNYGESLSIRTSSGMSQVSRDFFPWVIGKSARTVRLSKEGEFIDSTVDYADRNAVLAKYEDFSRLDRLCSTPYLRPDGTIRQDPGYDPDTRTYLSLSEDMEKLTIPDQPSPEEVQQSVDLLKNDLFQGFPFATQDDFANAVALLLTPFVRGMMPMAPLAVIDGREPGVGKNLLAEVISIITTGRDAHPLPYSQDDSEQRKVITSAFRSGSELFIFDEAHNIGGASLARALTTAQWEDRILGGSSMGNFPNNVTWMALGNQVEIADDLGRRVYRIHLAYEGESPENRPRSFYRHPDLKDWVHENRGRLISACLTICRYWFSLDKPSPDLSFVMGSFEKWQRILSGILESAGVHGFLDNVRDWRSESDYERRYWVSHLIWLSETFGNDPFRSKDVRGALLQDPNDPEPPPGLEDTSIGGYHKSVGRLYSKNQGRLLEGYRLARVGVDRHKVTLWQVQIAGDDDEGDDGFDPGPDSGGEGPDDPGGDSGDDGPDQLTFDDALEEPPAVAENTDPEALPGQLTIDDALEDPDLVFDIETHDADKLWSEGKNFVILSGYESEGEQTVTRDHSDLVSKIHATKGRVVGHSILEFDLLALARYHGLDYEEAASKAIDPKIVARQIDPPPARGAPRGYYSLNSIAERLGVPGKTDDLQKLKRKHKGYGNIPIDEFDPYLKGDLSSTRAVYEKLKSHYDTDPYIRREHRVASRMARVSLEGFRVDTELLNSRLEEQRVRKNGNLEKLKKRYDIPLEDANGYLMKSPLASNAGKAALQAAFKRHGAPHYPRTEKTGTVSTSKDDLARMVETYSDPNALRKHRIDPDSVDLDAVKEICELVTDVTSERTVYKTVNDHMVDGRVHPKITPEQASGRWSVTNPGLTVLGKREGKWRERDVFLAEPGHVLVTVDLDQVDARAVAGHSQDPAFMALFEPGRDFHSEVAYRVFGRSDGEFRERAKVGSHGYSYGLGAGGLASQMGVEMEKAQEFISQMREQFPIHADWQDNVREQASAGLLLDNGFGRKIRPDPERAYTQGPGLIGQGTTRDIIAEGVLNLPAEIVPMLRVVIHDELVFSLPEDRAEELLSRILEAMTMEFKGVPITAGSSGFGKSWGSLYDKG